MEIFNKLSIFLFLSLFLLSSVKTLDDFLECFSHQMNMNSSFMSQIIYTPQNLSYSTILKSYIQNQRLASASNANKPSIILTPSDESQIQAVVHCARFHGLQIRVRSGGHDYEGLSYISETPFVVIDLRNLRTISIDTTEKTAWIQAGATLGEVYHSIAGKSKTLSFAAGVCPTVGVGGHFSGGGYGMMSRKFGLAADNIIDAKIIDVEGRILDRKSMGEDLFWAIRGGGGASFGIITSWKVKLLDIPEKVTVFKVGRTLEQNATQLVHKWQHIAPKVDNNLLIRIFVTAINETGSFDFSFVALYVGGIEQLFQVMQKSFPELGLLKEDCIEMSWIQSVLYFADFPKDTRAQTTYYYYKAKSDYVQHVISMDGLKGLWNRISKKSLITMLEISPYGGKLDDYSESETPFPHRAGNIFMIHYWVGSQKIKSSKEKVEVISQKLYRYMTRYVSKSPRAAYVNYRDLDLGMNDEKNTSYAQASVWGMKYFGNNFKKLVKVKTKVDPTNFFRNEQSIPPFTTEELSIIRIKPNITFSKNLF